MEKEVEEDEGEEEEEDGGEEVEVEERSSTICIFATQRRLTNK